MAPAEYRKTQGGTIMKSRVEDAAERHKKGYNCSQAVVCTYCDLLEMGEKEAFRISEGFGAGMGAMESTCGALSGAIMLAGLKKSDGNMGAPKTKGETYGLTKEVVRRFQERCGATICREIKGVETGKPKYACRDCVRAAAAIAEDVLFGEE